jgi:hypothetical protein
MTVEQQLAEQRLRQTQALALIAQAEDALAQARSADEAAESALAAADAAHFAAHAALDVQAAATAQQVADAQAVIADAQAIIDALLAQPAPPDAPQLLRTIILGQSGPYVASVAPVNRGEVGTYNRVDSCNPFDAQGSVPWSWESGSDGRLLQTVRLRMVIEGNTPEDRWVSDYQLPTSGYRYTFNAPLVNGHHLAYVEAENSYPIKALAVDFVVNDTGAPLPVQRPWKATNRYYMKQGVANCAVQIEYADRLPTAKPLKPRTVERYSTPLGKSAKWVSQITESNEMPMIRFASCPTGDVVLETGQKYFHGDAITAPGDKGPATPVYTLHHGPRWRGTLGPVSDARIRKDGKGIYLYDTLGRFVLLKLDGTVVPEFGPELKPGRLKPHSGVLSNIYLHYGNTAKRAAHSQWFKDQYHDPNDWRQVIGPHWTFESWAFDMAMRLADGTITVRDAHEFWFTDTRYHRLLFGDHWTRHSAAGFQRAHFPPAGYIQADGPTGMSTMANFVGGTRLDADGNPLPEAYCHEPMYVRFNPFDQKVYWTQIGVGDHAIYRCNNDGTNIEQVLRCCHQLTYADVFAAKGERLGLPNPPVRNSDGLVLNRNRQPIGLRETYGRDGHVSDASCVFPCGFDFDSQGRLVFIEHYTYAIRRIDLATMTVETIGALLDINGGSDSSGNREPVLAVDREGETGAIDTIRAHAWSNGSDKSMVPGGAVNGQLFFNSGKRMPNGPAELAIDPNYGWAIDAYQGVEIGLGNASGSQFVYRTKRLDTDPGPRGLTATGQFDLQWKRGEAAWNLSGVLGLALGQHGQGQTGLPNCEDLACMDDQTLTAFLEQYVTPAVLTRATSWTGGKVPATLADVAAYIRSTHWDREVV